MKNRKKMMLFAAAVLSAAALFAGCTTASAVSIEEARDLVLETAGWEDAVVLELETDREDGIYELELIVDGVHYEYEVDSRTGQIREVDREAVRSASAETVPAETKPYITMEQARAIAYAHAGVDEEQAADKSYDSDNGRYEIDFTFDGWDYEYEISNTGEILKSEKEPDEDRPAETKPVETVPAETKPAETVPAQTQPQRITREEAIAAACAHAGVSVSDTWDRSCEWDDGCYEVEFHAGSYEYDYEISSDGSVISAEKDREDDHHHDNDHDDHHH